MRDYNRMRGDPGEVAALRAECERLDAENAELRSLLTDAGLPAPDPRTDSSPSKQVLRAPPPTGSLHSTNATPGLESSLEKSDAAVTSDSPDSAKQ